MNLISKYEAYTKGLKRYYTGKRCRKRHLAERYVCDSTCVRCAALGTYAFLKRNPAFRRDTHARWRKKHPECLIAQRVRRRSNLRFKLSQTLRGRVYRAVRGNYKSGSAVRDLGCSIEEFKLHIEKQFGPRMSWRNYGRWHLDHIKPLASFDLTDREQFLIACHFTNYQPLWALDNIRKGTRI